MGSPSPLAILQASVGKEKKLLLSSSFPGIKFDLFSCRKIENHSTKDSTSIQDIFKTKVTASVDFKNEFK